VKSALQVALSPARLSARVASLGRSISRDYAGHTLDVVLILENAFIFGADLVRRISRPMVCHFVRSEMRDVTLGGYVRREIFFSNEPELMGRHVLLVDAVLHSGVTQDFLLKRLMEGDPAVSLAAAGKSGVSVNPQTLEDGQERVVAQRLKEVLRLEA